jgi:hypothetical protein
MPTSKMGLQKRQNGENLVVLCNRLRKTRKNRLKKGLKRDKIADFCPIW